MGGVKISLKAAWATEPRGNRFSLADRDTSRVHLCFKFYIVPKQDYTRDNVAHVKQPIHYTTLLIINYPSHSAFKTTSQSRLYFCPWPLRFLQQFELGWRWHFSRQAPNNPRNTTFPQGCVGVIIPLQKVHLKCADWLFLLFSVSWFYIWIECCIPVIPFFISKIIAAPTDRKCQAVQIELLFKQMTHIPVLN